MTLENTVGGSHIAQTIDLDLREDVPPGEPQNAHSHIAAILFGSSEVVHIVEGELQLGTFQSVMMIELDGPKADS